MCVRRLALCLFFFNDTATTEIYTLSLHDALPILDLLAEVAQVLEERQVPLDLEVGDEDELRDRERVLARRARDRLALGRSEEHTSELQSRQYLVCRLLLEKKKNNTTTRSDTTTSV